MGHKHRDLILCLSFPPSRTPTFLSERPTKRFHCFLLDISLFETHVSSQLVSGKTFTYPSENWTILPFFDQAHQLFPLLLQPSFFKMRTTLAGSIESMDLATLHTSKFPSLFCTESISAFCFEDDACHCNDVIGAGAMFEVVRVWRIVKEGDSAAMRIDPFWYL